MEEHNMYEYYDGYDYGGDENFTTTFYEARPWDGVIVMDSLPVCNISHQQKICSLVKTMVSLQPTADAVDLSDNVQARWIWVNISFLLLMCLLGVSGNLITIIVFFRLVKRTATTLMIRCLAGADLVVCATIIPITLHRLFNDNQDTEALCQYHKFVSFGAIPLSGTLLILLAVDRFAKTWFPQHRVITKTRAKITVACLIVACSALAIPQLLSYSTRTPINGSRVRICEGTVTCNIINKCHQVDTVIPKHISHILFLAMVFMYVVIVTCLVVLYTLILVKVCKVSNDLADQPRRLIKSQTATSFVLVTLTFVIAYLPMIVISLTGMCAKNSDGSGGCEKNSVYSVLWNLLFMTHAINPIIYAFRHPGFHQAIVTLPERIRKARSIQTTAAGQQDCQTIITASAFGLDSVTQL